MPVRAFSRCLAAVLLLAPLPALGQARNADVVARLAADCLAEVPPPAFVLSAPTLAPYLRTALVARWQTGARRVFADTLAAYPRLVLGSPETSVAYTRAGRGRWGRAVRLDLPFTLTGVDGEIVQAGTCREATNDVVPKNLIASLEDAAYPETVGTRPAPGWVARYAEPALLGGALVVSTLLFFSLRSR